MRICDSVSTLKHSWEDVCRIFYQRYPNPYSGHVLSEDVLLRKIENNTLITVRLYKKTDETPDWLKCLLPCTNALILERSDMNLKNQTLKVLSKNITLTYFLTVEENSLFSKLATNEKLCNVERKAIIYSNFYGISYLLESFGLKKYKSNILRMDTGIEYVLNGKYCGKNKTDFATQDCFYNIRHVPKTGNPNYS